MRRKLSAVSALSLAFFLGLLCFVPRNATARVLRLPMQGRTGPTALSPLSAATLSAPAQGAFAISYDQIAKGLPSLGRVPLGLPAPHSGLQAPAAPMSQATLTSALRVKNNPVSVGSPRRAPLQARELLPRLLNSLSRLSPGVAGGLGAGTLKSQSGAVFDGSGIRDSKRDAVPARTDKGSLTQAPKNRLIKFDIDGVQLRMFRWALEKKLPDGSWLLPNYRILTSPKHGGTISWGGATHPAGATVPGWATENTGRTYLHGGNDYDNSTADYNLNLPNIITYVLNFFPNAMVEAYASFKPIVRTIWNAQTIRRNVRHELRPGQVRRHSMVSKDPTDKKAEADQHIVSAFISAIRKRDPQLLMAVFDTTDSVGHASGPDSLQYLKALVQRDFDLGRVLKEVVRSGRADEYSIMSGPDHGMESPVLPLDTRAVYKGYQGVHGLDPAQHHRMTPDARAIFRIVNVPEGVAVRPGQRLNVVDSMAIALKILLRNQRGMNLPERLEKSAAKVSFGDKPIPGRFSGLITGSDHPIHRLEEVFPDLEYPAGKDNLTDLPPIFQEPPLRNIP